MYTNISIDGCMYGLSLPLDVYLAGCAEPRGLYVCIYVCMYVCMYVCVFFCVEVSLFLRAFSLGPVIVCFFFCSF